MGNQQSAVGFSANQSWQEPCLANCQLQIANCPVYPSVPEALGITAASGAAALELADGAGTTVGGGGGARSTGAPAGADAAGGGVGAALGFVIASTGRGSSSTGAAAGVKSGHSGTMTLVRPSSAAIAAPCATACFGWSEARAKDSALQRSQAR